MTPTPDDINLTDKLTNYIIMKRNKKKEFEKERKDKTSEERLQLKTTMFGSKDADDCDNPVVTTCNDIGLYCPRCSEYMRNPCDINLWTCTMSSMFCSTGKNLAHGYFPAMGIDCHWRIIGSENLFDRSN